MVSPISGESQARGVNWVACMLCLSAIGIRHNALANLAFSLRADGNQISYAVLQQCL